MAFTQVTLTGTYQDAAGNPLAGTVTFTLTTPIANADVIASVAPITVTLENGSFSLVLAATDDPGTVPPGVPYGVTEALSNGQPRDYFISVSSATSPIDISTLMPGQPGWH